VALSAVGVGADLDWLRTNRDQLWAEASHREAAYETIWLDDVATNTVAIKAQAAKARRRSVARQSPVLRPGTGDDDLPACESLQFRKGSWHGIRNRPAGRQQHRRATNFELWEDRPPDHTSLTVLI
jgi:hypothetical protein